MLDDAFGGAADEEMGETGAAMGPDNDELNMLTFGNVTDFTERDTGTDLRRQCMPWMLTEKNLANFGHLTLCFGHAPGERDGGLAAGAPDLVGILARPDQDLGQLGNRVGTTITPSARLEAGRHL